MCGKVWGREDGEGDWMKEVPIWEKATLTIEEAAALILQLGNGG